MKKRIWLTVILMSLSVVIVMLVVYVAGIALEPWFNAERRFVKGKEVLAKRAYDRIMSMDPKINYPSSPEGVVDFFNETFYLMYSNSIIDNETLFEVMVRQRDVYSDELKGLNHEPSQLEKLIGDLDNLYAENNICLSVVRKGTVYDDFTPGKCVVQTMIYYNTVGAIYRNYFLLQEDNGRWKVNAWSTTDENFTIVEADI